MHGTLRYELRRDEYKHVLWRAVESVAAPATWEDARKGFKFLPDFCAVSSGARLHAVLLGSKYLIVCGLV